MIIPLEGEFDSVAYLSKMKSIKTAIKQKKKYITNRSSIAFGV